MRFVRSTRVRLLLVQVTILTIAAAATATAIFELVTVPARNQEDQALFDQWSAVANALDLQDGRVVYPPGRLPETVPAMDVSLEIDVFTGGGLLVQTQAQSLGPDYLSRVAAGVLRSGLPVGPVDVRDTSGGPRRLYAAVQPVGHGRAAVLVSISAAQLQLLTRRLLGALLLGGLLVVAIGGGLAWLVVSRTLRPVRAIAAAAREVGDQELSRRVTVTAPSDEVGELRDTFNEMLGRLERSFDTLRRFTADASHELRTPLTLMRTEVDVALARDRGAPDYRRALDRVRCELEHMTRVVDQLLLLAQADAGRLVPAGEVVDATDLVEEVAARWRGAAARQGVDITVEAPGSVTVSADPHLLQRVLDNLIDNALRYSPSTGRIELRAHEEGGEWVLEVADQGPGVAPEVRDRIFERFSRVDPARSRRTGGSGLGLALSTAVAQAHGGTLELVDEGVPGAVFRLRLPAAPEEARKA